MSEYMDIVWAFVFYASGTATGAWLVWKKQALDTVSITIDALCAEGYIRHGTNSKGDVELYKWNEKIDNSN